MYNNLVGGVLALSREQVEKTNLFSNLYWGWGNNYFKKNNLRIKYFIISLFKGAEDDDMSMR